MKHNDTITVGGYAFARHTIDNDVYYESPLTGELIKMTKPYTLEQYTAKLAKHIHEIN